MDPLYTSGLPTLAPRPVSTNLNSAALVPASQRPALAERHTEAEWTYMYPHIQRMYVQERRKLRYVMQRMEEKYGFKATSQMYKKRFARWGFHKNARPARRKTRDPASTTHSVLLLRKSSIDLLIEPRYHRSDAQKLHFLNSIKAWSSAFFETALHDGPHSDLDPLIPTRGPGDQPVDLEQLSFSFRLVAELLRRGQGAPAGRLARKAFLQVEYMLDLEGPLVTWDLLEILHSIAFLGQARLFEILVRHLSNLARSRFPAMHPLVQMLVGLRESPDDSFGGVMTLIERGWLLNAGLVFSNVHSRFQLMYHRLVWDSKHLRLPPEAPRQMSDWYGALRAENPRAVQAAAEFEEAETRHLERMIYATLAFPTEAGYAQRARPPDDYHALRLGSIADLCRQSGMELMDRNARLRVLVGLMKSGVPNSSPRPASTPGRDDNDIGSTLTDPGWVPRLHVRVVAFMATIALETDLDIGIDENAAAERLRGIIALREYGQGAVDPQVVYEFWQLSDVLARAGRLGEAAESAEEARKRLDIYLGDIPETLDGT